MSVQSPELQAVEAGVNAAADRLRGETNDNARQAADAQQALIAAASSAMAASVSLTQILAAEQAGHARVRDELGKELLRSAKRVSAGAARSSATEETRYVARKRLGLANRDIVAAGDVVPGAIRAILARAARTPPTRQHQTGLFRPTSRCPWRSQTGRSFERARTSQMLQDEREMTAASSRPHESRADARTGCLRPAPTGPPGTLE